MGTSGYVMPPKCQLSPQDIDEIAAGFHQVNALRALSKKFKIGQGRIRRIWAGVAYRASLIGTKVMVELTRDRLNEMLAIGRKLEAEIKPWPANLDVTQGLPSLPDDEQLARYIATLRIAHEASVDAIAAGAPRPLEADSYYNAVITTAFQLLPKTLYKRFADTIEREKIHRSTHLIRPCNQQAP